MSSNYLKNFAEGETIKASETNANNQFLLSKISDNATDIQLSLETQLSNINSKLETTKLTLEKELDEKLDKEDQETIIGWLNLAYSNGQQVGKSFTAPADGVAYVAHFFNEGFGVGITINGVTVALHWDYEGSGGLVTLPYTFILSKGDILKFPGEVRYGRFFPRKGAQ